MENKAKPCEERINNKLNEITLGDTIQICPHKRECPYQRTQGNLRTCEYSNINVRKSLLTEIAHLPDILITTLSRLTFNYNTRI
jgi:hypothetical protein